MRTSRTSVCLAFALTAVVRAGASPQSKPSFRVVSSPGFVGPVGLVEGSPGVFYSTTSTPAAAFSVRVDGKVTNLATLPGSSQLTLVVGAANNRFYSSVAGSPGHTYLFSVDSKANSQKSYSPQTLFVFLTAGLADEALLGWGGNASTAADYLITADLTGNVNPIYQFPSGDIANNNIIYASDGNYYGTAWHGVGVGGSASYVYRVTPSGRKTTVAKLPDNSIRGAGALFVPIIQASDGNFYGATAIAGANNYGSVYKLTPSGQYTTIYSFAKGSGAYPQALIQASDGNLYAASQGSGNNGGELSRITTSGQYTLLYRMNAYSGQCPCQIIQGSDGIIYGTTINGGPGGGGAVFALDAGLPKPAPQALQFHPKSGASGTEVRIWGYNLLKATVQFNGTAATTVRNSGPNYVFATVPAGATTGPITVTTPGGTSTTTASFTVK
jgi:uncharacterized repeat protein (TIGR03803 family)